MTPAVILRRARQDLIEASRYYEQQRVGRGRKFLERVDEAIDSIRRSPNAFRKVDVRTLGFTLFEAFRTWCSTAAKLTALSFLL